MPETMSHRLHRLIIAAVVVFFVVSAVAVTVFLVQAPAQLPPDSDGSLQTRRAWMIHLAQALAGVMLTLLPGILNRRSRLAIPSLTRVGFALFLLLALGVGSVWTTYDILPFWDKLQHAFSAALLTLLGAGLLYNRHPDGKTDVSRTVAAGFFFAGTVGVFWEFYEWTVDSLLGQNSQRFLAPDGTPLCGQAALLDTMGDFVTNTLGALVMALILLLLFRRSSCLVHALLPTIRSERPTAA